MERQLINDCEQNVRNEAAAQAHAWITHRLEDIHKKKNTIGALLQIIVPSEESFSEVQEIQSELRML